MEKPSPLPPPSFLCSVGCFLLSSAVFAPQGQRQLSRRFLPPPKKRTGGELVREGIQEEEREAVP